MKIEVQTDYTTVPAGESALLRIMVTLTAPNDAPNGSSKPLNLALVLDRSGSMAGEKLHHVKKATQTIFEMMNPEDVFSLVAYDHQVAEVVSPVKVGQARAVEERIAGLESGGSTCLSGGYELGGSLAGNSSSQEYTTRIILLSDGKANQGVTNPYTLAKMSADMLQRGISTTTIGVGRDYNEFLMGRLAEHGGGGAHFVERAEDAKSVFEEELGYLKRLVASIIKVHFKPSQAVEKFEQLNSYKELAPGTFLVGDAYQGLRKCLVLEARITAREPGKVLLGEIDVTWQPVSGGTGEFNQITVPVTIEAVPASEYVLKAPDQNITLEAAFLMVARAKREAIALADARQFDQAAQLLERCITGLETLGLNDRQLAVEIRELRERAHRLRSERERYFDNMERKRMFHESDKSSKGQMDSMLAMKQRGRAGRGHNPHGGHYPCSMHRGYPVVDTEQGLVLIDTGANASFGRERSLSFLGKDYPLANNLFGQTIEDIGQLVQTSFFALIGNDILNQFDWTLDNGKGRFTELRVWPNIQGIHLQTREFKGVPIIDVKVAGQPVKLLFDTCAKVAYLDPSLLEGVSVSGEETDFFPGFGPFRTPTYETAVDLDGDRLNLRFGVLPSVLNTALRSAGVMGIFGAEPLNDYQLFYSSAGHEICLERLQN